MKNKEDIRLEIMRRIMIYERKKLRLWYEVVIFVLSVILLAEVFLLLDLIFDIQESPVMKFAWIFNEDIETIKYLFGSVIKILWEELPWNKILIMLAVTVLLAMTGGYAYKRNKVKRVKAGQVRKYESLNK